MPWWAVLGGFFVTESVVFHLHFRSESGTFSLLELPLVFGLLFAETGTGVAAMLAGSVRGLVLIRRQPLLELAFNLANLSLHFALAFALLPVFLSGRDPLAPSGWLAVLAVTTLTAVLNFSMILVVVFITERQFDAVRAASAAFLALVVAAPAAPDLVAVLIVVSEPWAVLLLSCSALVLFMAYRAYVNERERRERVEFLYASTRALREGGQTGSAVAGFLEETASMSRATKVMLFLFPSPDSDDAPAPFTRSDGEFQAEAITEPEEQVAASLARLAPAPILVGDAHDDGLTGLANRATFATRPDELFSADSDGSWVLYVDLDDFKLVNDTYGHPTGDALLSQVATRIEAALRGGDLGARLGGDEFAVLLSATTEAIAHRLIGWLSAPFVIEGNDVRIGASIGLAHSCDARSSSQLLRNADVALYAAKEDGKGTVAVYGEHLRQNLTRQQTLQSARGSRGCGRRGSGVLAPTLGPTGESSGVHSGGRTHGVDHLGRPPGQIDCSAGASDLQGP